MIVHECDWTPETYRRYFMTAKKFEKLLEKLGACDSARDWCSGKTLSEAWKSTNRPDWLLWLCGRMADRKGWPTRKEVVLAACACAATSLKYIPKGERRPAAAIRTARRWSRGLASVDEVVAAARAAHAAYAAHAAAYASDAAYAAYAAAYAGPAAYGAAYAADAAYGADAAAYAADAAYGAAYAAAYGAYGAPAAPAADAAYGAARDKMCRIIRRMLVIPGVK